MPNWKKLIVSGSDATLNKLNVSTAVTASFFKGDGSALSNVSTTIAEIASKPDTFSSTTSKVITHNFGSKDVIVSVFDSTDNLIIPESIVTTDDNNVTITFAENTTGRAVVARGGHIVSGTVDYNQLSNIPNSLVSSSLQLASDISGSFTVTSASLASAIANFTSDYTELSNIPGGIVSSSIQLGSKISGSFTATSASLAAAIAAVSTDFSDITNKPTLISSSNQIASNISGSFTTTSASLASRITSNETITAKTLISSSNQIASNISGSFTVASSSLASRIASNETITAKTLISSSNQIASDISGSFTATSASFATTIGNLTSDYTELTNIPGGIISSSKQLPSNIVSSSTQLASNISGSFTATSSSLASRITSNETITAKTLISSSNQLASDISGSITLTSASLAGGRLKNTTDTLTGNLTVTGTINATKINTTIVSSSIAFSSGSNIFGDEASDEHEFTGSIDLTGPITASFLKGDGSALTNLTLSSGIISSSQQLPSGIISSSQQFPSSIISSSKQLPSGIISSSQQLPSNIVSSSAQLSEFSGSFSGSFEGDGSALTGVVANVTQEVTVTDTFSSVTSKAVTHNFGTKNVIVSVYDSNDQVIIPASITTTNVNVVTVTFATATSGRVVVAKGGHIVSGSIPVEIVEETTVLDTFTSSTSKAVTHNFGTKNVLVSVYDNTDKMIIPQEIVTTDVNTVTITLATATTGRVIVAKGGHLVSGSSEATVDFGAVGSHILPSTTEIYDLGSSSKRWRDIYLSGSTIDLGGTKITRDGDGDIEFKDSNNNLKKVRAAEMVIGSGGTVKRMKLVNGKVVTTDDSGNVEHPPTASHALTASFVQDSFISASAVRSGFGSGGTDISALSITGSGFTNASTVAVNHGFGTKEVVVSVYDNGDNLIMPSNIKTTTTGSVDITFAQPRTGRVVVSKGGHVVTSVTGFNAATAEALTAAGSRQDIVSVTTAVTASLFSTHLLRGHISMSLPSAVAGDWVKVSNRITSSYAHLVPGGAQKIMGSTDSLQIDSDNAGFELIYADSTDGWVIIGQ